jgi:hypothetical protein
MLTFFSIMMIDPEAMQAAHLLVEQHGRGALPRAEDMVDALVSQGDASGCRWWGQVISGIAEILQREHLGMPPADGEWAKEKAANASTGIFR